MKTETQLRGAIVILALSFITLVFFYTKQDSNLKSIQKVNTELSNTVDSLQGELFNSQVETGRYEVTMDHLKEVNPKLGQEMEDWLSHNTE